MARWVNIADPGDPVAIPPGLGVFFDGVALDHTAVVGFHFDFHHAKNYLRSSTTAATLSPTGIGTRRGFKTSLCQSREDWRDLSPKNARRLQSLLAIIPRDVAAPTPGEFISQTLLKFFLLVFIPVLDGAPSLQIVFFMPLP
ncbi:hypothetical protein [Streptomyces sp. NPDC056937]|uniref:hypothetical protein n=1 Tax=Streptomyces sp. NPDC056937 TaxID=3345969 RepID=UPI003638F4D4